MTDHGRGIRPVTDDELRLIRGGRSFWGNVKAAARWVKSAIPEQLSLASTSSLA